MHLAGAYGQGDVIEGGDTLERLENASHLQHGCLRLDGDRGRKHYSNGLVTFDQCGDQKPHRSDSGDVRG
ncbi:hypothetical protein GCM10027203_24160 [Nonomuraea fastidiosa]